MLRTLEGILSSMHKQLECRLTPLPELCRHGAKLWNGTVSRIFLTFAEELEGETYPDAATCMNWAIQKFRDIPPKTLFALELFGKNVGCYDLNGQLLVLNEVISYCQQELGKLSENREPRLRSYQTLGLCAGAALVILFI